MSIENQPESLKEVFFGMSCFSDADFDVSIEKIKKFNTLGHPVKIVYIAENEKDITSFKEKISTSIPEVIISYEKVDQDVYNKLENLSRLK